MVDALRLGRNGVTHGGSSPLPGTSEQRERSDGEAHPFADSKREQGLEARLIPF